MDIRNPIDENDFYPELTPLIDIMFLLLVFFMLTTTFLKEEEQNVLQVELPEALNSQSIPIDQSIFVSVGKHGEYRVDEKSCTPEMLPDLLKIRAETDTVVVIHAHNEAPYRSIIFLYDIFQSVGIRHFVHDVK